MSFLRLHWYIMQHLAEFHVCKSGRFYNSFKCAIDKNNHIFEINTFRVISKAWLHLKPLLEIL